MKHDVAPPPGRPTPADGRTSSAASARSARQHRSAVYPQHARFPRAKYLRQLSRIREELWWWAASYHQAAAGDGFNGTNERLHDRGYVLEEALHDIDRLRVTLEGLPRLS